jgi:iron(III) transport system substrate-binding protein
MSVWLLRSTLLACLIAAGCGAQPAPSSPPVSTSPAGAAPASAPAAPAWQAEWDSLLAAAKQEGQVTVSGPSGTGTRDVLVDGFQKKYGIQVEFLGLSGRELAPRVATERAAGQYRWDVYVHGTTTAIQNLLPLGAFDPIEPALILPDVKDPKTWRGGALEFADSGRMVLVMTPFQRGTLFVNPNLVRPEEFRSYKDLLDPKWKDRIVMDDPRNAGPGEATFKFFYLHPELGPEFIRALARQEPVIMKDYQQETDAIGQGRYPILLGTADFVVEARIKQGIPIAIVDPSKLREGSDVSPANGNVALFNRAPHPNAAKLYINWLLSPEAQTEFSREMGYLSGRLDVPADHLPAWRAPLPGAVKSYDEPAMAATEPMVRVVNEAFGR